MLDSSIGASLVATAVYLHKTYKWNFDVKGTSVRIHIRRKRGCDVATNLSSHWVVSILNACQRESFWFFFIFLIFQLMIGFFSLYKNISCLNNLHCWIKSWYSKTLQMTDFATENDTTICEFTIHKAWYKLSYRGMITAILQILFLWAKVDHGI